MLLISNANPVTTPTGLSNNIPSAIEVTSEVVISMVNGASKICMPTASMNITTNRINVNGHHLDV